MSTKSKIVIWVLSFFGGGVLLSAFGYAAMYWIEKAVEAELKTVAEAGDPPAIVSLNNRMGLVEQRLEMHGQMLITAESSRGEIRDSQQRFEELFIDYLQREAR